MAAPSPVDFLDIDSTLFKEFNLDGDQVIDDIISNSPKSILNLNCEDIPLYVDDDNLGFQRIPNRHHDNRLDHLHFNTSKMLKEQNNLNNNHFYQSEKYFLSSIFNHLNGQKSPDVVLDCKDEDFEVHFKDWCVDFPIDDLVSGTDNHSAGILDGKNIFPGDTQNVLDDDFIIKMLRDIDENENPKVFEGIRLSDTDTYDDTDPKICTPIYFPNYLQSESNHISQSVENETRSMKRKKQEESQKVAQVFRVERSLTKSKRRKVRDKPNHCYHLYDFIKDVLSGNVYADYPRCVEWVHEEEKEFRIVNTTHFAMLWGEIKASKSSKSERKLSTMTYEKVSRTLRYYSGEKLRILEKVEGKKCHFRFGTENTWSKHKM